MCGINGIFAFHPAASSPSRAEVLRTREAMRKRGPDGEGEWWTSDRRCGLGHRRLSIIDLSDSASQPMVSEGEDYVVVFNGEIYNYPELRSSMQREGARFRTNSDTEILLQLYASDGPDMVRRLRGMYAFAIWDRVKRGLFLARDPYGIKPLYTANDGWTFRFASQVKALVGAGAVAKEVDPAGVVGFYLWGSVPEPFSTYRDVRALPAGHTQWIDEAGPREPTPFTSLAALARLEEASAPNADLTSAVRANVFDSVRAHLLADVEVGVFLSSGVDSGALLGLMRDAGQTSVRAITLSFEEFRDHPNDEVPLAIEVAKQYGAKHIIRRVDEDEFRRDLGDIFEAMDQPSIDGLNTWFIAKAASEAGLKVAISGIGGDELLGGYPSFRTVPRWRRSYGPISAVPGLGRLAQLVLRGIAPRFSTKHPKGSAIFRYSRNWAGAYFLQRGLYLPEELPDIMDRDFAQEGLRRLGLLRRLEECLHPDPGDDLKRVCILESANYLRNQLLRDADWAGMAHSVEIRVPLVDAFLLRSMGGIIPKLEPGAGKAALGLSPIRPLPHSVMARAKTGFAVPTQAWMSRTLKGASKAPNAKKPAGLISRAWADIVIDQFPAAGPAH